MIKENDILFLVKLKNGLKNAVTLDAFFSDPDRYAWIKTPLGKMRWKKALANECALRIEETKAKDELLHKKQKDSSVKTDKVAPAELLNLINKRLSDLQSDMMQKNISKETNSEQKVFVNNYILFDSFACGMDALLARTNPLIGAFVESVDCLHKAVLGFQNLIADYETKGIINKGQYADMLADMQKLSDTIHSTYKLKESHLRVPPVPLEEARIFFSGNQINSISKLLKAIETVDMTVDYKKHFIKLLGSDIVPHNEAIGRWSQEMEWQILNGLTKRTINLWIEFLKEQSKKSSFMFSKMREAGWSDETVQKMYGRKYLDYWQEFRELLENKICIDSDNSLHQKN